MTISPQNNTYTYWLYLVTVAVVFFAFLPSCSSRRHVRHLASDALLIVPHQSTSKEVISLLGQPDQRRKLQDETEEWIYFYTKQSLMKKTPFIGKNFAGEDFDLIIVYINNAGLVTSSTYRLITEAEFKSSGIKSDHQLNAE